VDLEKRIGFVTRNAHEIVTREELRQLLETESKPKAYWGFESSGLMHIGMGLVCGSKIKDLVKAGFEYTIFLADWHSWINNKLGGNMENIRLCGEYFKECFTGLGIKPESVRYIWASDLARDIEYWEKVIRIAKSASLQRTWRALPIMGRDMNLTDMETAWVYYPCMQVADIFHMRLDVACAGMDQRKAHMLARDGAEKLGWKKPVCVHTYLLTGLQGPTLESDRQENRKFDENEDTNVQISSKMAKSKPETCIFVHDPPEDIQAKIKAAFCPPKQEKGNPVMEIAKLTIFAERPSLTIPRPSKYGGPITFKSYAELEKAYVKGELHPLDLKEAVANSLIEILSPVREYFHRHPKTLEKMKQIAVSR
jgi:tyrosyl-tRNA synthetase